MAAALELALDALKTALTQEIGRQDTENTAVRKNIADSINALSVTLDARSAVFADTDAKTAATLATILARLAKVEAATLVIPPVPAKPTFSAVGQATPTDVAAGATSRLTVTAKCDIDIPDIILECSLFDSANKRMWTSIHQPVSFVAGVYNILTDVIPMPTVLGTYTVKIGVFSQQWAVTYYWNDNAASIKVSASSGGGVIIPTPGPVLGTVIDANITPIAGLSIPVSVPMSAIAGRYPEIRPVNAMANNRPPLGLVEPVPPEPTQGSNEWYSWNYQMQGYYRYWAKITGDAGGRGLTTQEILEWGAMKWGLDKLTYNGKSLVTVLCAMAVNESWWRQASEGDKNPVTGLFDSFGILQVRRPFWPSAFASLQCTALNVDVCASILRANYDGGIQWLASGTKGNILYCIGAHQSGQGYGQKSGAPSTARPKTGDPDWNTYIDSWGIWFAEEPWKNSVGKAPTWF